MIAVAVAQLERLVRDEGNGCLGQALVLDQIPDVARFGGRLPRWQIAIAKIMFSGRERLDFYDILATYLDRSVRQPEALAEIRTIEVEGRPTFLLWARPLATASPHVGIPHDPNKHSPLVFPRPC